MQAPNYGVPLATTADDRSYVPMIFYRMSRRMQKQRCDESRIKPSLIGRYRKFRYIGSGNFGRVYLVRDELYGTMYAMKEIVCNNSTSVANVLTELLVLKRLRHNNLVEIVDLFSICMVVYVVTEFCFDGNLLNFLSSNRVQDTGSVTTIMRAIADGLSYIHDNGIVHYNLKPENILFTKKSSKSVAKIADYGLAKVSGDCIRYGCRSSPLNHRVTHLKERPERTSKPEYLCLSSEIIQVIHDTDNKRMDVYSMGEIFETILHMANFRTPVDPRLIPFLQSLTSLDCHGTPGSAHVLKILREFVSENHDSPPFSESGATTQLPLPSFNTEAFTNESRESSPNPISKCTDDHNPTLPYPISGCSDN
uniref:Calcium-dependent protein kinase 2-like n=1 Tax=Saccoglossus kowalevskii TaxID=10224 RepID=A0ABM0M2P8_SACKO|nr:PREDICTED: calcium-dependent protein kinase 2-like [Saccoglossus kowalevskii]